MKLSVISPTFNESANVQRLVGEIEKILEGIDYEIVIVDDDSPDLTWKVVEELSAVKPRVRLVHRKQSPGLSPSAVEGFSQARGEVVACIDADLQHDPQILPRMLAELDGGADLVVGSRYVAGGSVGKWSFLRRFESWVATPMARVLLGVQLHDPLSGFFMMRRDDFLRIHDQLNTGGFKILLEIISKLRPRNMREVGFTFRPRTAGQSKLSANVVVKYLKQLWRLSTAATLAAGLGCFFLRGRQQRR